MWIILLLGFFEGLSVSTAQRTDAILTNPAALAFDPGIEITYSGDGEVKHNLLIMLGNAGLVYSSYENNTRYGIAQGIALGRGIYTGFSYYFDESKEINIGFLARPFSFLSFGYRLAKLKDDYFNVFGLGVRPYKEYLTLFGDVMLTKDSVRDYVAGCALEPVKGLKIYGLCKKGEEFQFGVDLALGMIRIGASGNKDVRTYSFSISKEYYRTFIPEKKVIIVKLEGAFDEVREYNIFGQVKRWSFMDFVVRVDSLSKCKDVKGFVFIWKPAVLNFAQLEEIKECIKRIKERGKKVIFYSEIYGLGGYYLASGSDRIYLNPSGEVVLQGISSTFLFFKHTLDKMGIKAEFERIGRYKSAVEPFTSDTMSVYNREQLRKLIEDIYSVIKDEIEGLDSLIEIAFFNADEALDRGLVDGLIYETELDSVIKEEFGKGVRKINFASRKPVYVKRKWSKPYSVIAYVVADGSIVTGKSGNNPFPFSIFRRRRVGSETIERIFEKLRKDKRVKAVVLRVNSPGGSALASEIMWRAIKRCAEKKPVIVSMGGVAASGGYYISSVGTKILASKGTVTGSIGILGGKFVMEGLYEKLGITYETIKIGPHADAFSTFRSMTEEERKMLKKQLEWGYRRFLDRVSEGRGISPDSVDAIGEGRIWSGLTASRIGLVDKIGGVVDAVELAKNLAGVKNARLLYVKPFKKPIFGTTPFDASTFLNESYYYLSPVREIKVR